jgi:hypothetical protein
MRLQISCGMAPIGADWQRLFWFQMPSLGARVVSYLLQLGRAQSIWYVFDRAMTN